MTTAKPIESLRIRLLTADDIPGLRASCWPERSFKQAADRLMHILQGYARGHRHPMVAVLHDGPAVAFGQLVIWGRRTEIADLIVAEEYRGLGIGTQLITALLDVARASGCQRVEIGAALSNPRAVALYHRLGFVDFRVIDLDIGDGLEPIQYMALEFDT